MKIITVHLPEKFRKFNPSLQETIEWSESLYRTKTHKNGYKITIASIFIPAQNIAVLGASACAPGDKFDSREAAGRALGRARQQAFLAVAGLKLRNDTLLGMDVAFEVTDSWLKMEPDAREDKLRELAGRAVDVVAMHAENVAFNEAILKLSKRFPRHVMSLDATGPELSPFSHEIDDMEMVLNADPNAAVN